VFPCPTPFQGHFPGVDHYLSHAVFRNPMTKESFVIMITDRNMYKYTPQYKKVWQTDLRDIHSIDIDAKTHEVMTLAIRCNKNNQLVGKKGGSGLYAELIHTELCQAESIMARDLWATALSRVCRISYQKYFENTTVPNPEVYQWNVYMNKLNETGKLQVRCLVASTTRLYNIRVMPGVELDRRPQWAFPIASLVALITYGDNPLMFSFRVTPKTPSGTGRAAPMRELVTYVVSHVNERNFLLQDLKRLYRYNVPNKSLPEHHEKDHSKVIKTQSWIKSLITLNFGSSQ